MYVYISMAITLHRSMAGFRGASSSVHGERQQNSSRKQLIQMLGNLILLSLKNSMYIYIGSNLAIETKNCFCFNSHFSWPVSEQKKCS